MDGRFYRIVSSSDPEVIGVRDGGPQVDFKSGSISNREEYKRISSIFLRQAYVNPKRDEALPEFKIPIGRMERGARVTDIMSYYPYLLGCPFLVGERALGVLDSVGRGGSNIFEVTRIDGYTHGRVWLLQVEWLPSRYINFPGSRFYVYGAGGKHRYIAVSSEEDYVSQLRGTSDDIVTERIRINGDPSERFSAFSIPGIGTIISGRVFDAFVDAGISGFSCYEIPVEKVPGPSSGIANVSRDFVAKDMRAV